MILQDRHDGREAPFEGDRELVLLHLPADARIVAARATVTPIDFTGGRDPFVETILFQEKAGDWGATWSAAGSAVEVDLHARRTLAGVQGSGFNGATLLIDLGGAFAAADALTGALLPPGATPAAAQVGAAGLLPGLTTSRFRLTPVSNPGIAAVRVRSVPSNVSLALRGRPTFWFQPGELTAPRTTPDFSAVLQAWLSQAEVRDGHFVLPFVLHADGISRLAIDLEIEYLRTASVLPAGLREAKLPYAFGSLPTAGSPLHVSLPAGARLAPGASLGRALGAFDETRVAWGPTGEVKAPGSVAVTQEASLAQRFRLPQDVGAVEAVGVDLLLAPGATAARLQIDLRQDLDGKPGETSLWPSAVSFTLDPKTTVAAAWISVPLPAPVQIAAETGYWLLLQSLDGDAKWSAAPADPPVPPGLQRTLDGGLSWRQAATGPPLAALLRLREKPRDYRMPIELQIGAGDEARRVSLKRFNPLKRVELPFALPEIESAFDDHLAQAGSAGCPVGEHLDNGDFADWIKVGNQLGEPTFVDLNPNASSLGPVAVAVAASPDGRRAYAVATAQGRFAALYAFDLVCDRASGQPPLAMEGDFKALAVHPAGTRAYVLLANGLHVVDLAGWRLLGQRLPLGGVQPLSLAVSPGGEKVYLGFNASGTSGFGPSGGNIAVFEAARLDEGALGGVTSPTDLGGTIVGLGAGRDPLALAASADGSRLWVLAVDAQNKTAELLPIEVARPRLLNGQSVVANGDGRFLALAPDGALAVVSSGGAVDLVDLAGRRNLASIPGEDFGPVAIEPDGGRAFVTEGEDLQVIDLTRRIAGPLVAVGDSLSDVAVTPQGDRVLMSDGEGLYLLPVGVAVPAEWAVLSGRVTPLCAGEPRRRAALLGELTEGEDSATAANAVLSQVVPIAPGCPYELAFEGLATEESAVAEVLWHGADCAVVARAESIGIPVLDPDDREEPDLRSSRLRLIPPTGATQAEVRFRVPFGTAAVANVSLKATPAVLANGDLRVGEAGAPEAWTAAPAAAPGFSRQRVGDITRLRNSGGQAVTLAQQVPAKPGDPFVVELRGRTASNAAPGIAVHWLAGNGSAAAPPTMLEVSPASFDGLAASGAVPPNTARAELRLTLPPGSTLEVKSLDLRFPVPTEVPVTFLAEAPGELTVLDWQIAYEEHPAPPPPIPASGLCGPTPAAPASGGAQGEGDCCCDDDPRGGAAVFCPACQAPRPLAGPRPATTAAGKPVQTGTCPVCGASLTRFGGQLQPGTPLAAMTLAVIPGGSRRLVNPQALEASAPSTLPVTRIPGIGRGRARVLKAAGMDALEAIATSNPAALHQLLRGVTEEAASRYIASARELLRQPPG
jgi:DNA-binding beta-propeller fold protein YncE